MTQVRIIGGQWRGRKLSFPDVAGLRPTQDRIRETLFNWLMPLIANRHCLDLFAGSGALGFEALSRGAASVTFVEQNPVIADALQTNLAKLDRDANATIYTGDARNFLSQWREPVDVVFLDPPFAEPELLEPLWNLLIASPGLSADALVYIEADRCTEFALPVGWCEYRKKTTKHVQYGLYCKDI